MEIPYTVSERQTLCFSSLVGARERKKRAHFALFILFERIFFQDFCVVSMYSVVNALSEYTYFLQLEKHYLIQFFACF